MNRACIVLTLVGAAVVLLGFLLRSERGAWLIAGYNTMPKAERERYDKRALCRFMGNLMFFFAACILLMAADEYWPDRGLWLVAAIWLPIGAVGAVIYANTGGRFLKR